VIRGGVEQTRLVAAGIAFVAAAALLFCAVSRQWETADHQDGGFGPRGWYCTDCGAGFDGEMSNGELVDHVKALKKQYGSYRAIKEPSAMFAVAGWAALGTCALAAVFLIGAGATALRGGVMTKPVPLHSMALLFLFAALVSGAVFVATNPLRSYGVAPVGISWPFFLFAGAVVAGIVAAQMLAKFKKSDPGDIVL
jgi:hypothetical protein